MAVVLANGPYTPDGTEGQEVIDMYVCAQEVGMLWNTCGSYALAGYMY